MKEFKMDSKNNANKNLGDTDKELLRIKLEQRLQEYIRTNHGVYYQIVVENISTWRMYCDDHGIIPFSEPYFTVVIIYDKNFTIGRVYEKIRVHIENIVSSFKISAQITYSTLSEYHYYNFRKYLSKTTTIPKKWFDINDQALVKNKNTWFLWNNNINTFIYENNVVYLNIGYVNYYKVLVDFHKYEKRKMFPLFYVDILKLDKISYIYNGLKPIDGSLFNDEGSLIYYIDKLTNYINTKIDTDNIYKRLNQLKPQMLFFFNCLFHHILDDEQIQFNKSEGWYESCFEKCEFKLELTDDNTINFSYTDITCDDRISIQLNTNSDTNVIETALTRKEKTCYHNFPITNNIFEYDVHITNILSKLQISYENTDSDLQDGNREIIEGEEITGEEPNDIFDQIGK